MKRQTHLFYPLLASLFSLSLFAADVGRIDQFVEKARTQWKVPGLAIAIVKDGKVVLSKGYGVKQQGKDNRVNADTIFAIASNTKAFTATALAILEERGKIGWRDRVREHLPYFQMYDPYVTEDMRVDDLLCHRSGLGTYSGDLLWYGTPYSPREVLERTRYLPQAGPFRGHYGYSNLMFLAAGEVISEASGKTWQQFVHSEILNPLKMNRSCTSVKDLQGLGNYAIPHKPKPGGKLLPIEWINWDTMAAAGGINSSVNDMSKWMMAQLAEGKYGKDKRLFKSKSSRRIWSPHTIIPISEYSRTNYPTTHFRAYGLGWSMANYKGRKLVGHGGGYDGMFSRLMLVPQEKLGVVVLTNSMTGIASMIVNEVMDEFLGGPKKDWNKKGLEREEKQKREFFERISKATTPVAKNTKPSLKLADYCGTFTGKMYGDAEVRLKDEALVFQLLPNKQLIADLKHLHYDTFVIKWRKEFAWFEGGTAQFLMNNRGKIVEIKLSVPNDDLWFYELELKRK